jgi:hypothetical protein
MGLRYCLGSEYFLVWLGGTATEDDAAEPDRVIRGQDQETKDRVAGGDGSGSRDRGGVEGVVEGVVKSSKTKGKE